MILKWKMYPSATSLWLAGAGCLGVRRSRDRYDLPEVFSGDVPLQPELDTLDVREPGDLVADRSTI